MKKGPKTTVTARGAKDLLIERSFDAPPDRVFDALTRPALVRRWLLGPPGWTMTVCRIDARPGGSYRYRWRRASDGAAMGMRGTYRVVAPPRRLVHTESFDEPWHPGEAVVASTLAARTGRTRLTVRVTYPARGTRDGVLASGMEAGVAASHDRLDALLAPSARRCADRPASVEEYLARVAPEKRAALLRLRRQIRAAAPRAVECIAWGMPGFRQERLLVLYHAAKNHCSLFPMGSAWIAEHADLLRGLDTGRGTIRFTPEAPLPAALVRRIVRDRLAEIGAAGVACGRGSARAPSGARRSPGSPGPRSRPRVPAARGSG